MDIGGKMRESKFKYVIKRKNGWAFSETFTIEQIEKGEALLFLKINNVDKNEIHKYQYIGRKCKHDIEIYENALMQTDTSVKVVVYNESLSRFGLRSLKGGGTIDISDNDYVVGTVRDMPKA